MFYSKSTGGFYTKEIHGDKIPDDAVEITRAEYAALIDGQSQGKRITPGDDGRPVLQDPPPAPLVPKRLTSLEFLDLFTEQEQITTVEATAASAPMKLWYDRMLAASYITLEDPRTEGGLDALVRNGLLTDARKGEIVAAMS